MTYKKAIQLFQDIEVLSFRDKKKKYFHKDIERAFELAIKLLKNAQMHEDNLAEYMKDFNVSREQAEWDLTVAKQENTICYSDGCKKLRDKDYVLYNIEWLKKNYQQELDLLGVERPTSLEDKHITYTSKNGYTGILYSKSQMVIRDRYEKEVLHTAKRNVNTIEELIECVDTFPEFMEVLENDFGTDTEHHS